MLPVAIYSHEEHEAYSELRAKADKTLAERRKEHGIPDIPYCPVDDSILVYRLPAVEAKTAAGIVLPTYGIDKEEDRRLGKTIVTVSHRVVNVAVVLKAGLSALDWMRSHGVFVGDYVKFGRYSGQEESTLWFSPKPGLIRPDECKDLLQLNRAYVLGSFDLDERLYGKNPTMKIIYSVDSDGNGVHVLKPIIRS